MVKNDDLGGSEYGCQGEMLLFVKFKIILGDTYRSSHTGSNLGNTHTAMNTINNQERDIICSVRQTRNLGRLGWAGRGASMEAVGTKCKITVGKPEGNGAVGRSKCIIAYRKNNLL
jgi:hypothetical protein